MLRPPGQLAPPPPGAPSRVTSPVAGPTPPPPDSLPAARTRATSGSPAPAPAPAIPVAHPRSNPPPMSPDHPRRAAPAPPDQANHPPGAAPPDRPPRPGQAARQTAADAIPGAEWGGPSRGASRRGGRSGVLTGLSRTNAIRHGVGTSGRGAMSQVASAVMTLVRTPACRAAPSRCREGPIRSTAPHRGATLIPRADLSTWGSRLIRRWLHGLIRLRRHLPRQCQHNPRHRPVIHAASPHRLQTHPPRRTRAATKVRGHHGCLLEA